MAMYDNNAPYEVPVKAGKAVYLCRCGASKTPPFCDGSHKTQPGDKTPYEHKAAKDGTVYVCGCGKSRNLPWCDGSHKN